MGLKRCPLCAGSASGLLFEAVQVPARHIRVCGDRDKAGDYGNLSIASCESCGHIYNAAFDNSSAEELYLVHPSTNAPVHDSMLRGLRDVAAFILGDRKDRPRILEIGCGVGALARLLAEHADSVHLIEPNLSLSQEALGNPRIVPLPGFFPAASTGQYYDLIVCRQVLEHIDHPLAFLEAIRDSLAPGGEAYIEIPSMDYIAEQASPTDFHYLHVQYFTQRNIERLLRRVGFTVRRSWQIKNGHDIGFVLAVAPPSVEPSTGSEIAAEQLRMQLQQRRETGHARLASVAGGVAFYGACAYSQGIFGMYPDLVPPAMVFDDTESYAGYEMYCRRGGIPVELPSAKELARIDCVVICSYLHDAPIAANLVRHGYRGAVFSLRCDALSGSYGHPPSLFLGVD